MSKDKNLLASVSDVSTDSEFFSPVPAGYKRGKTRYFFLDLSSFRAACAFVSLPYFNPCGIYYIQVAICFRRTQAD